jgi:hypothetical protein
MKTSRISAPCKSLEIICHKNNRLIYRLFFRQLKEWPLNQGKTHAIRPLSTGLSTGLVDRILVAAGQKTLQTS